MAIAYETLLPEILPMVSGCLDSLIESTIRSTTVELCERASIYQQELEPVSTLANTFEYDLEPPPSTAVHKIVWMAHDGHDLEPLTSLLLEQRLPQWQDQNGTPAYFVQQNSATFWVAPVPSSSASNSIRIRAVLKPTHSSRSCDNDVMNNFRDTIVNGTLYRLLRIPNAQWTDLTAASIYANLYEEGVRNAEVRGRNADTGVVRKVNYGGIKTRRRTKRDY